MSAAEKLERLEAAVSTPRPWRLETRPVPNKNEAVVWNGQGQAIAHDLHDEDARLITALRNALPEIIAVVDAAENMGDGEGIKSLWAALAALDEKLRAVGSAAESETPAPRRIVKANFSDLEEWRP